ncbi:MAG: MBL fold metallo-hydrolase [Eubacterium sp.]|nr:MBL fold metallo-hydrolase [Eubacterium sp.]
MAENEKSVLSLTWVNVGYGEAILIRIPDSSCRSGMFTMLIDGGSSDAAEFADNQSGRMPLAAYLKQIGCDHIDLLVNTHIHEDHTSGLLEAVRTIPVDAFWQPLPETVRQKLPELDPAIAETVTGAKYIQSINDFQEICHRLTGKVRQVSAETEPLELSNGLRIRVLSPDKAKTEELAALMTGVADAAEQNRAAGAKEPENGLRSACCRADANMNNLSVILQLEYAGRKILLPGDTNRDGYVGIADADLAADIFKVGHHGQQDGISREMFRKIHPSYVICCASSDRRYDSAAPEILSMMQEEGAHLYFSDCPPVPQGMQAAPAHTELVFEIAGDGTIDVRYV